MQMYKYVTLRKRADTYLMSMEAGLSAKTGQNQKKKSYPMEEKEGKQRQKKRGHLLFLPLGFCELAGFPWGPCPAAGQHPGAKCPPPPASASSSEEGRPTAVAGRACRDLSRARDQVTAQLSTEKLALKNNQHSLTD